MPHRLPPVLSHSDLPIAELCAARLDGELFAVDGCFSPVDEIEQPSHRAAALRAGEPHRLIAEQLSAAWVWGALDAPPAHHQFCVATGARVNRPPARWMTLREVVINDQDIVALGDALVTSRARTVVDLARFSTTFGAAEELVVRRLLTGRRPLLDDAVTTIRRRRNLPNKRLAIERLDRCR